MRHSVLVGVLLSLASIETVSVAKNTDSDIVLKVSTDKQSTRDGHHFSGEWLESPWGDLYQFRAGDQNWLTAREHCLSLNADLAAIRNVEQLDWILSHYAPLSSRFAQRLVQIGLYAPEGQTHEWKWLNEEEINKTLQWSSGEPYDHSMEGRERCGLLNVEKRLLDDVDCESTIPDHRAQRYICQRTSENHKQQQRSNNYIWQKIENLFSFFGIGGSPTPHNATAPATNDYEDEVVKNETSTGKIPAKFSDSNEETSSEEEESVAKTLAALPKIEGSGESTSLKELQEPEGSGQIVDKKAIEAADLIPGVDEKKLDKMIDKMEEMIKSIDDLTVQPSSLERTTVSTVGLKKEKKEEEEGKVEEEKSEEKKLEEKVKEKDQELNDNKISESIEGDFDHAQSKDMPKADIEPPKEEEDEYEECDEEESGSGEEEQKEEEATEKLDLAPEKEDKIKEFLGVLRLFLDRAEHGDLRKLLDDQSGKTLLERMKNAVREANKREFEMLEKLESSKKTGDKDELVKIMKKDQMSTEEQKDLYKKISSAVMKAAKLHKIEEKEEKSEEQVQEEQAAMEKFAIAKEKADSEESEGTLEVLKSAREGKAEKKEKNREKSDVKEDRKEEKKEEKAEKEGKKKEEKEEKKEDKVAEKAKEEKDETAAHDEPKKEEDAKKEETNEVKEEVGQDLEENKENSVTEETTAIAKVESDGTENDEKLKEKKDEESTTPKSENSSESTSSTTEEPQTAASIKPAEAEENDAELEASGQEEVSTTTESTTVALKQIPAEEIEKIAKLEAKQLTEDEPVTEETKLETTAAPTPSSTEEPKKESSSSSSATTTTTKATSTEKTTTESVTTTKAVTVPVKTVSPEEMEKLSKMEATEKVTLLPPLPTFTFPTLAPFTFPTLPTIATVKPTPAPKVPTLEEILGNLNDQFKKLLSPPKPLSPK